MLARLLAGAALIFALAGPLAQERVRVIISDGPIPEAIKEVRAPLIIRAGHPPRLDPNPAPVIGPPNWAAALLMARTLAPEAQVELHRHQGTRKLLGAGVNLQRERGQITVAATAQPWLLQKEKRYAFKEQGAEWRLEESLPPGPAQVILGEERWPLCLPDISPLKVADLEWPEALDTALKVLPSRRVPKEEAELLLGSAPARREGWAPFAPPSTWIELQAGERLPAPLWFSGSLPPPGAMVRSWRALKPPGHPLLFAGSDPVVDEGSGPLGRGVRFGFHPETSDLPETAGWPVLLFELVEAARLARSRCRIYEAGRAVVLALDEPLEIRTPGGETRHLEPEGGQLILNGLDTQGFYRLSSSKGVAWLGLIPPLEDPETPPPPGLGALPEARHPGRSELILFAVALLLLAAGLSLPRRGLLMLLSLLLSALALLDLQLSEGPLGAVVLAVDLSASMPPAETKATVRRLEQALDGLPLYRVEGDFALRRVSAPGEPLGEPGGGTAHAPLLASAAELAGKGGVVLLLSDGRAPDGPIASPVPIFTFPIDAGPDAWIESAEGLRLGAQIFLNVRLGASTTLKAKLRLGSLSREVQLEPLQLSALRMVLKDPGGALTLRLEAPGDIQPANDVWPLSLSAGAPMAVLVGAEVQHWAEAAGLQVRLLSPQGLLEAGGRLSNARALLLHDQAAEYLPPEVLQRIDHWVQAGGLLLLSGRRAAFGPGGWAETPLERLSPLRSDPRPPNHRLGVALLLDRSGSMHQEAGGPGAEALGRLAARFAGGLRPQDSLAILAFGLGVELLQAPKQISEMGPLPLPAFVQGGTKLRPALERARALLSRLETDEALILLLSDGRFLDAEDPELLRQGEALKAEGLRLLALLVGERPEREPLNQLAEISGGRTLEGLIPNLALAEALGGDPLAPGGQVTPGEAWSARLGGEPPLLRGRVRVSARPEARVLARVGGEPLLAEWAWGRGRVIALASDAWELSPRQWASLLSPAAASPPQGGQLSVLGDRLIYQGDPDEPAPWGLAQLQEEGGAQFQRRWQPRGPGRALLPLPQGSPARLKLSSPSLKLLQGFTRPSSSELALSGSDRSRLRAQAEWTGGRLLEEAEVRTALEAARRRSGGISARPLLLLLSLLLLFGEVWRWSQARERALGLGFFL